VKECAPTQATNKMVVVMMTMEEWWNLCLTYLPRIDLNTTIVSGPDFNSEIMVLV
jgi:hypothetical protein